MENSTSPRAPSTQDELVLGQMGQRAMSRVMSRLLDTQSMVREIDRRQRGLRFGLWEKSLRGDVRRMDVSLQELHDLIAFRLAGAHTGEEYIALFSNGACRKFLLPFFPSLLTLFV
jgi:hypothetical protein